ncbi:MAG: hypothetical protein PVG56_06680, partial [Anaerolineae bacterium]
MRQSNGGPLRQRATLRRSLPPGGLMLLGLLFFLLCQPVLLRAQTPEPTPSPPVTDDLWIDEKLASMTTADKIGQLFLVTFPGDEIDAASDIGRLVQILRVGGVLVSAQNQNLSNNSGTPEQVLSLTRSL